MSQAHSFQLTFPEEVSTEAVTSVLRTAASGPRGSLLHPSVPIRFYTVLTRSHVSWYLELPRHLESAVRRAATRELPGLRLEPDPLPPLDLIRAVELRVDSPDRLLESELAQVTAEGLLGVAERLGGSETVIVQWLVGAWLRRSPVPPARAPEPRTLWNLPEWGQPDRNTEQVAAFRKKQQDHIFAAVGRIAVAGAEPNRARSLISTSLSAYGLLRAPGVSVRPRWLPSWWVIYRFKTGSIGRLDPPARLSAAELAGLIGWPIGNPPLPGVRYEAATLRPLDERVLLPEERATPSTRLVGVSGYPAQAEQAAALGVNDALRHLHVLGPTGVGKSTLLARLILSDIAAGRGVVAIDPKGDLVDDILARLPDRARERVVVLDPTDDQPVGLNPVTSGAAGVDGVLHVLRSIWKDSWGPRLGDVLHAGLLTLASDSQPRSLCELPLLLGDQAFRRPLVQRAQRRDRLGLGTFWPWFEGLSDESRAVVLAPVMNKLRALLMRPDLRAVLGQPEPRFDLTHIFSGGRVLLVRLPKGQLGTEGAQLLGSLLVAQLWRLALARAGTPARSRRPVLLYLDEFQEFLRLNLDLGDALVQARGLGVGLTLAHQHLDQLDRATRTAVLANVGSRVAFRLDLDDAAVIARRTGDWLEPRDYMGLPAYQAYASLLSHGDTTRYGSLRTVRLGQPVRDPQRLHQDLSERWGVPRAETEARLAALLDGQREPTDVAPLGGRRKATKSDHEAGR